jgi:hypothetical protein
VRKHPSACRLGRQRWRFRLVAGDGFWIGRRGHRVGFIVRAILIMGRSRSSSSSNSMIFADFCSPRIASSSVSCSQRLGSSSSPLRHENQQSGVERRQGDRARHPNEGGSSKGSWPKWAMDKLSHPPDRERRRRRGVLKPSDVAGDAFDKLLKRRSLAAGALRGGARSPPRRSRHGREVS